MPEQTDSKSGQQGQVSVSHRRRIHDDRIDRGQGNVAEAFTDASPLQILPIDIEDEVSWLLHEFRRQGSPVHSIRRNTTNKVGKTATHPGYFCDVRYRSVTKDGAGTTRKRQSSTDSKKIRHPLTSPDSGPCIEVSYLFDKVLSLTFHVYIRSLQYRGDGAKVSRNRQDDSNNKTSYTTFVTFVGSDSDDGSYVSRFLTKLQWSVLKVRLASICDSLNGNHPEKRRSPSSSSSSSLFAVLSKLLLSLNQLQTELRPTNSRTTTPDPSHDRSRLLRPLTDRQRTLHLDDRLGNGLSPRASSTGGFPGAGTDLAILLLRCAAAGKHRELFSHPFPRSAKSGPIAETIWKATEYHQRFERRRHRPPKSPKIPSTINQEYTATSRGSNNENARTSVSTSPTLLPPSEQVLLGFLCSLPWMKRGKMTVTRNQGPSESKDLPSFDVCLHLDVTDAVEPSDDGDASYSPRFARSCHQHGGLVVYHGTQMENVWSILNNGFWNPSDAGDEFVKNGAMMGSGVYVTTSKKVATFFATAHSPARMVRTALKHDSIVHLISMAGGDVLEIASDATGVRPPRHESETSSFHDSYEVSCFPVFEARIVRPPDIEGNRTDRDPSSGLPSRRKEHPYDDNNDVGSSGANSTSTRRDGKYYVVSDARDVRITKLHLTFELKRTRPTRVIPKFLSKRLLALIGVANAPVLLLALFGLAVSVAILWCRGGTYR